MNSHPKAHDIHRSALVRFLLRYAVPKGNSYTHTSLGKPAGSFYIPVEAMSDFYKVYTQAIDNGEEVCLTEKHRHISPIIVDLDFRFPVPESELPVRHYSKTDVQDIVQVYIEELIKIFQPTDAQKSLSTSFFVYVLEKPSPVISQKRLKDGIHIVIPDLVSKPSVQYVLRNRVLPKLAPIFSRIGVINKPEDVVDEAIIERNNWMMYGSRKPNAEKYEVTHLFEYTFATGKTEDVIDEYELTTSDILVELSIRNKLDETLLTNEVMEDVNTFERVLEERRRKAETARAILSDEMMNDTNEYHNLDEVKSLVDILSHQRADTYSDWIRVGWCLRNIDHRILSKWIEFSKKSSKFKDGECERVWPYMKRSGLGVGTLHMWAKNDNPQQYAEIIRKDLRKLLSESRSGTHNDVARVVHYMFQHEYVCTSIKHRAWFEFKNHRWHQSDSAFSLRMKLSNEVWREYMAAARDLSHRATEVTDHDQQEKFHDYARKMIDIATKLKSTSFKDNVMKECSEMFYVEKFLEKLDSHPNLIGFENGVYDLDAQEFREGRPEDYVSFSTNINYVKYEASHPIVQQIKTYFAQVLPMPSVRQYVLKLFATFLSGNIKEQKFNIWTGSGCHAKDTMIMMADGSTKAVQDICIGDHLMGDDSTPRNITRLCRGFSDMYKIIPIKGEPFIVNGEHVLSLQATNMFSCYKRKDRVDTWVTRWMEHSINGGVLQARTANFHNEDEAKKFMVSKQNDAKCIKEGDIIDVKVCDYLRNCKRFGQRNLFLYRPSFVEFPCKEIDMDPYILGAWLGDGSQHTFDITTMDDEIITFFKANSPNCKYHKKIKVDEYGNENRAATYSASKVIGRKKEKNDMVKILNKYNLVNNKHIPLEYKCNTKDIRMRVLAGLIDTDGTYQKHTNQFTITQKNERLMDDIIYIARSLGFACYKKEFVGKCTNNGKTGIYYQTHIVGEGIEHIPTLLHRKRAVPRKKNKATNRMQMKIEKVDDGDFYGFETDGNHRYLMADFMVTHNSNSKSLSINLFENSFGDYCCKFPITLLTQKRAAANAATSELARAKGKRFACLQEPSEDEKLNIGLMKELSGGDKIMARALFSEPIEFTPQFKMLLLCNHLPSVPSDDGGTWRRIRVVEFTSKFVDNPQESNEYPIDYDLPDKMLKWKEHFMAMLLDYYRLYKIEGNPEPEEVLQCTRDYKRQNDHLSDFVQTCLEQKSGNYFLSINEAFMELKSWAKDDNVPVKIPTKADLEKYLSKVLGKCTNSQNIKGFRGWRIRTRFDNNTSNIINDQDEPDTCVGDEIDP